MSQLNIVLMITLFMMVMFIWGKYPFGLITMTCCVLLVATGVTPLGEAFTGFGNKIVVLIAPTLALSSVLSKTDLVKNISDRMSDMKERRGTLLILSIFGVGIILAQFIPSTAIITIMIVFLSTLGDTGEITPKRILLPLLGILTAWKFRLPIGLGATTFAMLNGFTEGIITNPEYQITMLQPFLFSIIPTICLSLYCVFFWKLMPKEEGSINKEKLKAVNNKESELTKTQQNIVYIIFTIVMLTMILNKYTKDLMYIAPATGVIILIFMKILPVNEAVKNMSVDMVWMLAGVLIVSDALGKSGAGELIGNTLLKVLGDNPSSLKVMFLFSFTTVLMTTFLSNMGTQSILIPIAASLASTAGWDPRGIILIIGIANYFAISFPSGSGEAAVAFGAGAYNPVKVLKFTLPFVIIAIVSCALTANFMFPIN